MKGIDSTTSRVDYERRQTDSAFQSLADFMDSSRSDVRDPRGGCQDDVHDVDDDDGSSALTSCLDRAVTIDGDDGGDVDGGDDDDHHQRHADTDDKEGAGACPFVVVGAPLPGTPGSLRLRLRLRQHQQPHQHPQQQNEQQHPHSQHQRLLRLEERAQLLLNELQSTRNQNDLLRQQLATRIRKSSEAVTAVPASVVVTPQTVPLPPVNHEDDHKEMRDDRGRPARRLSTSSIHRSIIRRRRRRNHSGTDVDIEVGGDDNDDKNNDDNNDDDHQRTEEDDVRHWKRQLLLLTAENRALRRILHQLRHDSKEKQQQQPLLPPTSAPASSPSLPLLRRPTPPTTPIAQSRDPLPWGRRRRWLHHDTGFVSMCLVGLLLLTKLGILAMLLADDNFGSGVSCGICGAGGIGDCGSGPSSEAAATATATATALFQ